MHPYTQALLSAVPVPDPRKERARERIVLEGDVPSPVNPPSGCRFRTRCWKAQDICAEEEPPLVDHGNGQQGRLPLRRGADRRLTGGEVRDAARSVGTQRHHTAIWQDQPQATKRGPGQGDAVRVRPCPQRFTRGAPAMGSP